MIHRSLLLLCLTALAGCNLVAYDILASGRDLSAADGGPDETRIDGGSEQTDGGDGPDPCLQNNGGCDKMATCERDGSQAVCKCPEGYRSNGKKCDDVNECLLADRGGCSPDANCINEPGSVRCECKSGFTGDGVSCADIDECAADNGGCDAVATCTNTSGGRTCACPLGYSGGEVCERTPWPVVGRMPLPMNSLGATVWNNRLYIVEGNGPTSPQDRAWFADFLSDGRLGTFTPIEKSNGQQNHCLAAVNGVLYMVGGGNAFGIFDDVLYAPIASNGTISPWAKTTALPAKRTMAACLGIGNRLYVLGGGYNAGLQLYGSTDVLMATANPDGTLSGWSQLTPLPEPLLTRGVTVLGDRIYLRGDDPQDQGKWPLYSAQLQGDGTIGEWTKVSNVLSSYSTEPLVGWGQTLHIGAGRLAADVDASGVVSEWRAFDPEVPVEARRAGHASVVHNGRAYIVGGNDLSGNHLDDIRTELLP